MSLPDAKKSLSHHLLNRCIDLALLGNRGTNTNMDQIYGIRTKTFIIKETEYKYLVAFICWNK